MLNIQQHSFKLMPFFFFLSFKLYTIFFSLILPSCKELPESLIMSLSVMCKSKGSAFDSTQNLLKLTYALWNRPSEKSGLARLMGNGD